MQLLGQGCPGRAEAITDAVANAAFFSAPFLVWCDGEDITAVIGDDGDTAADVLKMAARMFPPGVVAA